MKAHTNCVFVTTADHFICMLVWLVLNDSYLDTYWSSIPAVYLAMCCTEI